MTKTPEQLAQAVYDAAKAYNQAVSEAECGSLMTVAPVLIERNTINGPSWALSVSVMQLVADSATK